MLIVTADDWGIASETTDAILECFIARRVTSVSAMVYMEDAERAATLTREHRIPTGLHLNLSEFYTATDVSRATRVRQERVIRYFTKNRWMKSIFNPFIASDVSACIVDQLQEFSRIYKAMPKHIDSHHHMHVSPNVLLSGVLPRSIALRRTYTYAPNEKPSLNRAWRYLWNRYIAHRYPSTAMFLDFQSLCLGVGQTPRLEKLDEAYRMAVELMTHPGSMQEFDILMSDRWAEAVARFELGTQADVTHPSK